jgi:peptidoglycan/xylan/chitin deacetylase (PgdA/CDA1 family)
MSIWRRMGEAWEVPRDLLLRRYPPFVTGGPLPRGHVPVFVFHSLEPESFGRKLDHLAGNGYRTLSAEEYRRVLDGRMEAPDKAVVLTFDDGRGSLWSVGRPLLRRHGMRGIVFLIPGRIPSRSGPLPPDWDDVLERRASAADVLARENGEGAFLSWEEIKALSSTGVFDFQSHTLTHARVHVAPEIVGFLTPSLRGGYQALDVPLVEGDGRDLLAGEIPLGTPLLRSAPRTAEVLRFYEDPASREACVETVAGGGGEAFFRDPRWEEVLHRRTKENACAVGGRRESEAERETAVRRELADARERIEGCTGETVDQLCYPWHASGPTSRRLAGEVGYRLAFCGKVPGTPVTLAGGDSYAIARIGEDYVELLPGSGRKSLFSVLLEKWTRRFPRAS